MKIKDGYIVRKIGNKYYAVSVSANETSGGSMVSLNETGAFIWELLKEETDLDSIAKALAEKYDIDIELAKGDSAEYIKMLSEVGAIA